LALCKCAFLNQGAVNDIRHLAGQGTVTETGTPDRISRHHPPDRIHQTESITQHLPGRTHQTGSVRMNLSEGIHQTDSIRQDLPEWDVPDPTSTRWDPLDGIHQTGLGTGSARQDPPDRIHQTGWDLPDIISQTWSADRLSHLHRFTSMVLLYKTDSLSPVPQIMS